MPDYPNGVELTNSYYKVETPVKLEDWDWNDSSNIKWLIEMEFGKGSEMIAIARCESGFRQFKEDGTPLYNAGGSSAVGVFQIMESIHGERAEELNLDIVNSAIDNVAFAIILYNEGGNAPWKECL